MPEPYTANDLLNAIAVASKTLSERKDEINRLNVFPVPDGDTGTNMSLTLETVVENLANLPIGAAGAEIRKAITTGALMGARGNSGVITSQILRGLCEGSVGHEALDAVSIDAAFSQAVDVAFQAVRKPVEGTILTVLRDSAAAAKRARKKKLETDEALAAVVTEAYASVQRTPDLLPVLKENGVVDAGGYGLAIFFDAFVSALLGKEGPMVDELAFARGTAPKVEIEQINDWEGSAYRYCTEFLVHSDTLDVDAAKDFLTTMGDCDLMVGMHPNFKVHVHSNRPDQVLGWFLTHDAQISEVHIHNMQQQIGIRQLLERCLKRRYEMMRQLADESYRIRKQYLLSAGKLQFPGCGVKGCKQLVFCQDSCPGQRIKKRRLSCIGIPYDGRHRNPVAASLLSCDLPVTLHVFQFPVQLGNPSLDQPSVHLQFLLSRPSGTYAASQPGKRRAKSGKPGLTVF